MKKKLSLSDSFLKIGSKKPKESDYWETPKEIFDEFDREFQFEWDACANAQNTKVPGCYFNENDGVDALSQDWAKTARVFWTNPPYSDVTPWLAKAKEAASKGCTVVLLLKSDHSTRWFKDYIYDYNAKNFYPGVEERRYPKRIKFKVPEGMVDKNGKPVKSVTPPWPSIIVIFRPT